LIKKTLQIKTTKEFKIYSWPFSPGGNVDDDNSDTTLDKDEHPVYKENDLWNLIIQRPMPSDLPGSLTLQAPGTMTLWEVTSDDIKKVNSAPTSYLISSIPANGTNIDAEGTTVSSYERDSTITLSYTAPDGTTATDTVVATIFTLQAVNLYYHSIDEFPFTDTQVTIKPLATMQSGNIYKTSDQTITDTSNWYYNFPSGVIEWKNVWGNPSFVWKDVTHTILDQCTIYETKIAQKQYARGRARWYGYTWSNSSITGWGTTTTLTEGVHRYKTAMTVVGTKQSPDKENALKIKIRGYYENDLVKWASACLGVRYEWGGYGSDRRYAGGKESPSLDVSDADCSATGYIYRNGQWIFVSATPAHEGYGFDCSGLVSHVANICGYFSGYKTTLQLDDSTITETVTRTELHAGDLLLKPGHHVMIVSSTPQRFGDNDRIYYIEAIGSAGGSIVREDSSTFGDIETKGYKYKRLRQK